MEILVRIIAELVKKQEKRQGCSAGPCRVIVGGQVVGALPKETVTEMQDTATMGRSMVIGDGGKIDSWQ
jgi:hypothetical protein